MRAWLSADAEQWARLRPAAWARPLWSVLALIVTVVWAVAVEPDPPCSVAAPCGPDWGGMGQVGLAIGLLYWWVRLPELALVAAPALAVIVAWGELPGAGRGPLAANAAVIAALAFGWAAAGERLAVRRRQRRLVERAAGGRHPLPDRGAGPLSRGGFTIAAALVLSALAVGAVVMGLRGIQADEDHAARATRTTARVVHKGEDSVRLRTADARHLTVDAFPEDYRTGSTVTVLEDGTWRRLASEPYDAFGWQLLTLAAALPALSLLTAGVLARGRTASVRRAPVPALRVLRRTDAVDATMWIYAADDGAGRAPLFKCYVRPTLPGSGGPEDSEDLEDSDGPDEPDEPDGPDSSDDPGGFDGPYDPGGPAFDELGFPADPRLSAAVMYGAPCEAAELVFLTTGTKGNPLVLGTFDPVRLTRAEDSRVRSGGRTAPRRPSQRQASVWPRRLRP